MQSAVEGVTEPHLLLEREAGCCCVETAPDEVIYHPWPFFPLGDDGNWGYLELVDLLHLNQGGN